MTEYDEHYLEETLETALGDPLNYHVPTGISRYDYGTMHGWYVRIYRDRVQFQELFHDSHYPSISECLRAAILFRHEILSTIPLEKKVSGRALKSLPTEPEERIRRREEKGRGKKSPYVCWKAAYYDENHKIQVRSFSVKKYGEEEAKRLALEYTKNHHNNAPRPESTYAGTDQHKKPKYRAISREDVEVLSTIDSIRHSKTKEEVAAEESYPFAYEGERKLQLHMTLERDKKLRELKIKEYLEKHGEISCEICSFNFKKRYPFLEKDIIEVHHITPLAKLSGETKITLNDLILVCSNCHLAIHQGDEEANLISALNLFGSEQEREH